MALSSPGMRSSGPMESVCFGTFGLYHNLQKYREKNLHEDWRLAILFERLEIVF